MKVILFSIFFTSYLLSSSVYAGEEHHNLSVIGCRSFPNGDLQIRGVSSTDNQERHLHYSNQMFSEKIIDRYHSICLTAFASGATLRTDYLECTGTTCSPKSNTTSFLMK